MADGRPLRNRSRWRRIGTRSDAAQSARLTQLLVLDLLVRLVCQLLDTLKEIVVYPFVHRCRGRQRFCRFAAVLVAGEFRPLTRGEPAERLSRSTGRSDQRSTLSFALLFVHSLSIYSVNKETNQPGH